MRVTGWRGLAGASIANFAMQIVAMVAGFGSSILLGRWLGAGGLGVYASAFAMSNVLGILARMGLDNVVVREVAVARSEQDGPVLRGLASFSLVAVSAGSVVVAMLTILATFLLDLDPDTRHTTAAAMLLVVVVSIATTFAAILRGLDAVVVANLPDRVVRPLLLVAGLGAMLTLGVRPEPARGMLMHLGAAAVALILTGLFALRWMPEFARRAEGVWHARRWAGVALPMVVLGGLGVINRQTDVIMLGSLSTSEETGAYAACVQLASVVGFVLQSANLVLAPRFAALNASGDREMLQRLVAMSSLAITVFSLVLASSLVLLAEPLLGLFGPAFVSAKDVLLVLTLGSLVNALAGSVGFLLIMTGHERAVAKVLGVTALMNVILNALLIPRWGGLGAATASCVATVTWNLTLIWLVHRTLGVTPTALGLLRRGGPR